jgi:hypothetical protein
MTADQLNATSTRRQLIRQAGYAVAGLAAAPFASAVPQDNAAPTRRIWLRLLTELVEADVRAGKKITEEQRFLGGLTSIKFVYLDERNKDVILEGPAEDKWVSRDDAIVIGERTGRPLLQLDDFAIAWRNTIEKKGAPEVSLDPRRESTQRIQEAIRSTKQPSTERERADYTQKLRDVWGPQDAVTRGVPTNSRFNKIMVDADWEMKRISLGLSDTGIDGFPNYADIEFDAWRRRVLAEGIQARRPEGGSRFWFYPAYSEFEHSEKLDAVEIPGNAVQLLTESHFRNLAGGGLQVKDKPSETAKEFVGGFTRLYPELAKRNPLFADLHNLFDWVAVSRLLQSIDAPRRIGWDLGFLARGFPVNKIDVPPTMPGQVSVLHAEVKLAKGLATLVMPARSRISMEVRSRTPRTGTTRWIPKRSLQADVHEPSK